MNWSNIIIIVIVLIMTGIGMRESVKHFKGEGLCCGSSSKPKKKKLNNKIQTTYVLRIEGMHCQNCANAVTRVIQDIEGAIAKVHWKKKKATVYCDRNLDCEVLKNAIQKLGYDVIDINMFSGRKRNVQWRSDW